METTAIAKKKSADDGFISQVYAFRELIYYFAWREFKVRYKQTAIGVLWVVFQPLLFGIVITLLLFRGNRISFGADLPVILPVFVGLLFWNYFEQSVNNASNSLVNNQSIITKVYFPRFIPALAAALAGIIDFVVTLAVLLVMLLAYQVSPDPLALVAIPFALAITFLTIYGAGLLMATLNMRYRDIKFALPFALRIMLFATPVFYPLSFLPERFHWIILLNPVAVSIELARSTILSLPINVGASQIALSVVVAILLNVVGYWYFKKRERQFADIV